MWVVDGGQAGAVPSRGPIWPGWTLSRVYVLTPIKGTPSIPETYLLSSVAWGLNLRVG